MKKIVCKLVLNGVYLDSRVLKEADSLRRAGYKVTIIGVDDGWPVDDAHLFDIKLIKIRTRFFKSKIFLPIKFLELYVKTVIVAFVLKPDIIHCHDIGPVAIAKTVSFLKRVPLIYDSHELEYDRGTPSKILNLANRYYERLFIHKVDRIIVSDGSPRTSVMEKHYFPLPPTTYVRNCPPMNRQSDSEVSDIRREIGQPASVKVVLFIGFLGGGRGIDETLETLRYLPEDVIFVIMGGGQFTSAQEKIIQSHSLASRVFVIGPYPYKDVVSYARSADIGICLYQNTGLSVYLSTPTKLFDYINAGIPILASDFPGIAEILEIDSTVPLGATVEPNNVKAITQKVLELLNLSKFERDCIAQRMRTLHKNSYNWEQQEIKLLDVYTRVSLSPKEENVAPK